MVLRPVVTLRIAPCPCYRCWARRLMGTRTPTMPPRHRPGTWLLRPIRDASVFREPTPLWAFATTREDWVTCWRTGDPSREPHSAFPEIYGPVGLLDGGVELAPLSRQLVHPAPQRSHLDGRQDADLRPPVARQQVGRRAHERLEGPVAQRQGVAARQGIRERRLAVGKRRRKVRPVDAPYIALELGDNPLRLIEEHLRVLRWALTLLDEGALLEPPPHLLDPPLQISPVRQCLCQLHDPSPPYSLLSPRGSPVARLRRTGAILHVLDCMSTLIRQ